MNEVSIIKIGGNIIDDETQLTSFLRDFSEISGYKILVHGGGKIATNLSKQLGIEAKMIEGRRITDKESLKIVTMVYAGYINKNIVAKLHSLSCKSIGLSGVDGFLIPSERRASCEIDFGFVGDPLTDQINIKLIETLLLQNLALVIAPITMDQSGQLLNTNADTIASSLAIALSTSNKTSLYYCFEKDGVLTDVNDSHTLIKHLNYPKYLQMKMENIFTDGMLPKLDNAFKALQKGTRRLVICHAKNLKRIISKTEETGTTLTL